MTEECRDEVAVPQVSVVMAAYNYGPYIGQAIQSVVDQTFLDWELIVVDDGSDDETEMIVRRFVGDPRIRYHRQENQGQPKAKNTGIRLSRGRFIAFLDADDAWMPDKLAKQLPLFENDPDLGVAYTGVSLMDEDGISIGQLPLRMVRGRILEIAIKRTIPPFSSSIVRREIFDDIGYFDEELPLAIDFDLWLRAATKYRFDYVDEPLLLYRSGHANLSRRAKERRELVLKRILPRFISEYGGQRLLSRRSIAEAYADTYVNTAESLRDHSLLRAFGWNLRACAKSPWMLQTWKSLLRTCVPRQVLHFAKTTVRGRGFRSEA